MSRHASAALLIAAIAVVLFPRLGHAQFFIGSPTPSFTTTSGTISNTPAAVPNNPNMEIDVNGQFIVNNATPAVQTSSFDITCQLDPTFNGGSPIPIQLQINQNGFVTVPAGGQIYGWTLQADLIDNTGVGMGGLTSASSPSPLYGPGTTTYGPTTTLGPTFTYNPAIASIIDLKFTSNFDGLVPPNSYTWDFPLSVKAVSLLPEPTMLLPVLGSLMVLRRRRLRA